MLFQLLFFFQLGIAGGHSPNVHNPLALRSLPLKTSQSLSIPSAQSLFLTKDKSADTPDLLLGLLFTGEIQLKNERFPEGGILSTHRVESIRLNT